MGNCCRRESSVAVWAGDDWGSLAPRKRAEDHIANIERQRLLGEDEKRDFSSSSSSLSLGSSTRDQVKIKITKRELEEIMARVDMQQGLSMEQVLARLINDGNKFEILEHHRSWKPALQSIPEVN